MIAEEHIRNLIEAVDAQYKAYPNWKARAEADKKALATKDAAIEFLKNQDAVERILQKID
jgi:hypothetical protein